MMAGSILITGASSGIGAALAQRYAAPGTRLLLWGRHEARLAAVAAACEAKGAAASVTVLDLRQSEALIARLEALDETPALAILNAGIGGVPDAEGETPPHIEMIAAVNFTAPLLAATLLSRAMVSRGQGHIVLMGSIAECIPLPMAPSYAASKAGLAMFAEALSVKLSGTGVAVTLVSPGFIDTPMSQGLPNPRPFLVTAEAAADILFRKLPRRPARIVIPWQFAVIGWLVRTLPRALVRFVLKRV
jgi:short-subunit dehydrogenase